MFCVNCALIFQQSMAYNDDDVVQTRAETRTWTAEHSYVIPYQNLLTTATGCHCCHEILSALNFEHYLTVLPEKKLHVSMKMGFDRGPVMLMEDGDYGVEEDSIGDDGILDVRVSFRRKYSCRKNSRKKQPRKKQSRNKKYCRKLNHIHNVYFKVVCPEVDSSSDEDQGVAHHSRKMPVTGGFTANNTGSEYTAGFVKKCLEHCRSHHTSCRTESTEAPWYPTRLVEVLEGGAARVIETSETIPTGPYATLSHCWGTSRIITATTNNINRLKKHIAMLDLPKTFRDALQFVKAIGISLIWIDSLCIIQDSVRDWERESRTMFQVYRHAECNLAATGSEDSHGGLFAERN